MSVPFPLIAGRQVVWCGGMGSPTPSRPAQSRGWQEIWVQILVCSLLNCMFPPSAGLSALVFPSIKWEQVSPLRGKELAARESSGRVHPGSACEMEDGGGRGTQPSAGSSLSRGAGPPVPRGRASPAPPEAPTWLSAAAAPLPRSPGAFCANQRPGPTPRQTPGSRPEEAPGRSPAPREPNPRGGGSGSHLNTSPAPPRLPPRRPRGPSASRGSREGGKHLGAAEAPAGKRRVVGAGWKGRRERGRRGSPVPARPPWAAARAVRGPAGSGGAALGAASPRRKSCPVPSSRGAAALRMGAGRGGNRRSDRGVERGRK